MLERYAHPTDAETRRAVASASRLTMVGTKTGTATTPRTPGQGPVVRRWLEWNELMWRPQGEPIGFGQRRSPRTSGLSRGIAGRWTWETSTPLGER